MPDRKLDEAEAVPQLDAWLAPNRVLTKREPATDTILVKVMKPSGEVVVAGYKIALPVNEHDLRTHANSLREAAGLPELPSTGGRGFFGDL